MRVSSSATTVARAEPLTALVRSAHSRVSLVAPLSRLRGHSHRPPLEMYHWRNASHAASVSRRRRALLLIHSQRRRGPRPESRLGPIRSVPSSALRRHDVDHSRSRLLCPRSFFAGRSLSGCQTESRRGGNGGDLRERPRRRATERSEGALLAAPQKRPLSPKSPSLRRLGATIQNLQ